MRTVFLVPRRNDGGLRDELWRWCRARWEAQMPDVPIYEGYHTDGPFNRSAAINSAARLADLDGRWDVAVVLDSDVFLPISHVRAAIASAGAGKVTWAHRRWRNVAAKHLPRLLKDPDTFGPEPAEAKDMDLIVDVTNPISWSCCVAVPRSTFDDMGGFDERFRGWGFEDGAWSALVRALYPWARIEGDMYHLDHPRSDERIILGESRSTASSDYVRNALLGRRYMIAAIRDHAAGDQPGEERLSPEMVKVHVANLTHDDEKFLAMARARNMPEAAWSDWWPTLEELRDGAKAEQQREPTVAIILRTGGEPETWSERRAYLRRSIESLVDHVDGPIVQRVIYSDWGPKFRAEIDEIATDNGFYVVGPATHVGYTASVRQLWRYIGKRVRADYVFVVEDDFLYERDVDLVPMIEALQGDPNLRQVALLRAAFYPRESDGILGWPTDSFTPRDIGNGHGRLEHRLFWTMNPSVFPRSIAQTDWPSQASSERVFGDLLLRDPLAKFALWGDGDPWITHLGVVRASTAY